MKRKIFFAVLVMALCSVVVCGQTRKFAATVFVQVISSESEVSSEMHSFVTRELRSLNDVTVQAKADYSILIFIEKISDDNGSGYYALTYNFGKTAQCTYKQTGNLVTGNCNALVSFNSMSLFSADSLKAKATSIVVNFDTGVLDPDRKLFK